MAFRLPASNNKQTSILAALTGIGSADQDLTSMIASKSSWYKPSTPKHPGEASEYNILSAGHFGVLHFSQQIQSFLGPCKGQL